jgi:hypothetical protein
MDVFVQIVITLCEELSEITSFHHAFENKKLQELDLGSYESQYRIHMS